MRYLRQTSEVSEGGWGGGRKIAMQYHDFVQTTIDMGKFRAAGILVWL